MNISNGDFVTRKSYNNDTLFKVININNGIYYLKGVEVRLYADSAFSDLIKVDNVNIDTFERKSNNVEEVQADNYFYLPAKILHVDGECILSNIIISS